MRETDVSQATIDPILAGLDAIARHLHLDRREVAAILGVSEPALRSLASLAVETRRRLEGLVELAERVNDTFEPAGAEGWLTAPSRDLRGATPLEELRVGRVDAVDAALEAIDSGVYV